MNRRRPQASTHFAIGAVVVMLALWLRLLVPAGWMPVASGGGVLFTLCSGSGGQQVIVGKDGRPVDAGMTDGACAFSGIGTPALPELPPAVSLQIFATIIALGLAATMAVRLPAIAWLRPPLRGPPLHG